MKGWGWGWGGGGGVGGVGGSQIDLPQEKLPSKSPALLGLIILLSTKIWQKNEMKKDNYKQHCIFLIFSPLCYCYFVCFSELISFLCFYMVLFLPKTKKSLFLFSIKTEYSCCLLLTNIHNTQQGH